MNPTEQPSSNIFYFLGNLPTQMHGHLPLYEKLPGTCLVLSQEAQDYCRQHNLKSEFLDTYTPRPLPFRPQKKLNYVRFDFDQIPNTLDYLNKQTGVLILFDTFTGVHKVTSLKKAYFSHGGGLKTSWLKPWRVKSLNQLDAVATLGPHLRKIMMKLGIQSEKLIDLGVPRRDELIQNLGKDNRKEKIFQHLGQSPKPIITYVPTWYGVNSVEDVGKKIIENISDDYILIFKPHPETPPELLQEYKHLIDQKSNVLYAPEGLLKDLGFLDFFLSSDAFIMDMSSVLVDALVTEKPILFALGGNPLTSWQASRMYGTIQELYDQSQKITLRNVNDLNTLFDKALREKISEDLRKEMKSRVCHNLEGNATEATANFLRNLA